MSAETNLLFHHFRETLKDQELNDLNKRLDEMVKDILESDYDISVGGDAFAEFEKHIMDLKKKHGINTKCVNNNWEITN